MSFSIVLVKYPVRTSPINSTMDRMCARSPMKSWIAGEPLGSSDSAKRRNISSKIMQQMRKTVSAIYKPYVLLSDASSYIKIAKKKAELASLGEWTHINCLDAQRRDAILDVALRTVANKSLQHQDADCDAPKKGEGNAYLGHIRPDYVQGGSICFAFEKCAQTA